MRIATLLVIVFILAHSEAKTEKLSAEKLSATCDEICKKAATATAPKEKDALCKLYATLKAQRDELGEAATTGYDPMCPTCAAGPANAGQATADHTTTTTSSTTTGGESTAGCKTVNWDNDFGSCAAGRSSQDFPHRDWNPEQWCCDEEDKVRRCVAATRGKTEVMYQAVANETTNKETLIIRKIRMIRLFRNVMTGSFGKSSAFEASGATTLEICKASPCDKLDALTEGYSDDDYKKGNQASSASCSALALDFRLEKKLKSRETCTNATESASCTTYDVTKDCSLLYNSTDSSKLVGLISNYGTAVECAVL